MSITPHPASSSPFCGQSQDIPVEVLNSIEPTGKAVGLYLQKFPSTAEIPKVCLLYMILHLVRLLFRSIFQLISPVSECKKYLGYS